MLRSLLALYLSVLLLSACGTGAGGGVQAARPSPECALAESYIASFPSVQKRDRVVFTDADERLPDEPALGAWTEVQGQEPQPVPAPSAALLAATKLKAGVSAVRACANVRALLDRQGIHYGSDAAYMATRGEGELFGAAVLGVALPSLSADGTEAVLAVSERAGRLFGSGNIEHLKRKRDGTWTIVGVLEVWVS